MVTVKEVVKHGDVVYCNPNDTVLDAVKKMHSHKVGSVLVMEGAKLVGIFTERDLVRIVSEGGDLSLRLSDAMSRNVLYAHPEENLLSVGMRMIENWIRHMPVIDSEGRVVGVLSMRDVLRRLLAEEAYP